MIKDKMRIVKQKKILTISVVIILILSLAGLATCRIIKSRTFQCFGGIVSIVNTQDKVIALTFDDGPSPKVDTILSILNAENVKATFFLTGDAIKGIIEGLKSKGYAFKTVNELLEGSNN